MDPEKLDGVVDNAASETQEMNLTTVISHGKQSQLLSYQIIEFCVINWTKEEDETSVYTFQYLVLFS